jgi:hypothetical protein
MSIVILLNRDNVKTDLGEIGCGDIDWIGLAQESSCECSNESFHSIKRWKVRECLHNWWPPE